MCCIQYAKVIKLNNIINQRNTIINSRGIGFDLFSLPRGAVQSIANLN